MAYGMYRAVRRVWRQRRRYLWLGVQVLLGVCMLSTALNLSLNARQQASRFRAALARPFVDLTARGVALGWEELEKLMSTGAALFYQYGELEGCPEDFPMLFVDQAFLTEIMGMKDPPAGRALVGKNVQSLLDEGYQFKGQAPDLSKAVPLSGLNYQAKTLLSHTVYLDSAIFTVSFDEYLILPLKEGSPGTLHAAFPSGGQQGADRKLNEIQNALARAHPEGEYQLNNYLRQTEDSISRNKVMVQTLQMLAGFVILIVAFGLTGLLLVLMNSRQRELAISLMCGATYRQLMAEVFLEIFLVTSLFTAAGNLLCAPFLPIFGGIGVKPVYMPSTLLMCLGGAAALSLGTAAVLFHKIMRVTPIMALKDL